MGNLADVLRSLREDAGATQEELAEKAGVSVRTVSDIERGVRKRLYRTPDVRPDLDLEFRRRFVAWHLDRVCTLTAHTGNEEEWYRVLDADRANVSVALRWAHEAGDTEALLQLCAGLFRYWQARGDLTTGRRWLECGLGAESAAAPRTRMAALWALAWLALQQQDDACVTECATELAALADEHADAEAARNAATVSGMVALSREDAPAAAGHMQVALSLARDLGDPWLLATSLLNLGVARISAGETAAARELVGEALLRYAELGDERFRARSLGYLGLAELVDGNPARAEALYRQSLILFNDLREGKGVAESLTGLATAAAMGGRPLRAARLGGAAERIRESFAGGPLPVEGRLWESASTTARATTGEGEWAAAWTGGRAMRDDQAVAAALFPTKEESSSMTGGA